MNVTRKDKTTIIDIISRSMYFLQGIKWIIGDNPNAQNKKMTRLAEYIFETGYSKNGIYLSSDRKGVAIMYPIKSKHVNFRSFWNKVKLIFLCIGVNRIKEMYLRELYLKQHRPSEEDFLYFWVYSVLPESRGSGTALELKNIIFSEAHKLNLPIYLETSRLLNKRVYERYGFQVYHEWHIPKRNLTIWFMSRKNFIH